MHFPLKPTLRVGKESSIEPGQLVLLGLESQQVEAWTGAAQVLGMRCAIASSFDECAAYALGVGPTVYVGGEQSFQPRMVSLADAAFRRTTLILLSDSLERIIYWRLLAWDAISTSAARDQLVSPLTAARAEAQRRLAECQLIEDVHRREASLGANEKQVLEAICAGRLNKQIASEQNVSVRTVEQRRRRVFEKMGVESAVPLAAKMAFVASLEDQARRARSVSLPNATPAEANPPKPKLPVGIFAGGVVTNASVTA